LALCKEMGEESHCFQKRFLRFFLKIPCFGMWKVFNLFNQLYKLPLKTNRVKSIIVKFSIMVFKTFKWLFIFLLSSTYQPIFHQLNKQLENSTYIQMIQIGKIWMTNLTLRKIKNVNLSIDCFPSLHSTLTENK
jgi:hypothetical protein